jgi:hypothetical protein
MQSSVNAISFLNQIAIFIAVPILIIVAWNLWLSYIQTVFLKGLKWTLLEVKPPKEVFKSPAAMELVLNSLYAGAQGGDWYTKYWKGEVSLWHSLEIISIEDRLGFLSVLQKNSKRWWKLRYTLSTLKLRFLKLKIIQNQFLIMKKIVHLIYGLVTLCFQKMIYIL